MDLTAGVHGVIRIRAKTAGGEFWEPKTKVNRAVPISSTLREYLDRYEPRIVPGRWYFPSPKGTRWDPDNFYHALQDANKKAGLPWSCLDFRHNAEGRIMPSIMSFDAPRSRLCRVSVAL